MNVCGAPLGSTRTDTTSSSGSSALRLTPTRNSPSGMRRSPRTLAISTRRSSTSSGGNASPAGDAVPRLPPSVPRLRICGEPTVRDASASAGSSSAKRPLHRLSVGQPGAEDERAGLTRPAAQLCHLVQVDQRGRARAVEVELDEHVGAALDEARLRQLRLRRQRLVERARGEDVHRSTAPRARRAGRAPPARRASACAIRRRDEHEHDDRHHVGQRLEHLGRDRHPARLQRERQRLERAEEIRADEAELRPPEREDDERDRDPAGTAREPVHPLRRESRG